MSAIYLAAGPYSQAVKTSELVFSSGQLPMDSNGVLTSGTIAQKTESCIKNLRSILDTAGREIKKVIKVTVSTVHFFYSNPNAYSREVV
ncbi:RutC family protein y4sK [Talaromyces pinophilus]|nr:RutC family protein y4sK [Talaromyces pinophilus]